MDEFTGHRTTETSAAVILAVSIRESLKLMDLLLRAGIPCWADPRLARWWRTRRCLPACSAGNAILVEMFIFCVKHVVFRCDRVLAWLKGLRHPAHGCLFILADRRHAPAVCRTDVLRGIPAKLRHLRPCLANVENAGHGTVCQPELRSDFRAR